MDKLRRQQIRSLVASPQWNAVTDLAQELCNKLKSESVVQNTEWETLKKALGNEGMIQGMQYLLQELWKQAGDD